MIPSSDQGPKGAYSYHPLLRPQILTLYRMSFLSLLSPALVFKLVHLLLDLLLSNLFVVSQYANPSLRGRRNTENPLKNVLLLLTTYLLAGI